MQTITNVMEGIRCCSAYNGNTRCTVCPYEKVEDCDRTLAEEAIEYLGVLRNIKERCEPESLNWLIDKLREYRQTEK